MANNIITNVREHLHRIRAKLYQNNLKGIEGKYLARTANEASLKIDDVCAALKNRGGFYGSYEELVDNVYQFFDEAAYQLLDGYSVNMGYFAVYPHITGTFDSTAETYDKNKNPVRFRFRTRPRLRRLIGEVEVLIEGLAGTSGCVDKYLDTDENEINSIFVPGNQFVVSGNKIRIEGNDPNVGLYFVPVDNPSGAVKVTRIAENSASKIIGIAPQTGYQQNRIEIRTQYSGSGSTSLKEPRTITSPFILEEA
ncbi:MAG: DUF4469 domain-containing protein [Treponema sp.]|jgi:hypothetical protein|nr:DUF4469 domain-containing protein [Treponema sp.]